MPAKSGFQYVARLLKRRDSVPSSAALSAAPQPMSVSNSAKLAVPSMGPLRVTAIAPLAQA